MRILDIDYEKMIIKKETIMDRVVYTIDNFYKHPNLVVSRFRKFQDKLTVEDNKYPGENLNFKEVFGGQQINDHIDQLKQILSAHGYDILSIANNPSYSKFCNKVALTKVFKTKVLKEQDTLCNPHSDCRPSCRPSSNLLACLCYLSKDVHGGTGLYHNKQLNMYSTDLNWEREIYYQLWRKIKASNSQEEISDIIEAHYLDMNMKRFPKTISEGCLNKSDEFFELMHYFPMKFNRLVVYQGDILHGMYIEDLNFFKTHERLTTNYFFPIQWGNQIENKKNLLTSDEYKLLAEMIADAKQRRPYIQSLINCS
tara:strand:+ start:955 stop:1890 length:936 start_codon:yes stop_codon:yes gene_type:complete